MNKFQLSDNFYQQYSAKKPDFGFGDLGHLVYIHTYSRLKDDGNNETWPETVRRVVEGTYNIQKRWIDGHALGWNAWQAQRSAQEMFTRMFEMKFLPPGRGLWAMGSRLIEERGMYTALNNCAFVSTDNLRDDPTKPFCFLMDMSMLGVGVGFDTQGENTIPIVRPEGELSYTISDDREGWIESLRLLLSAYLEGRPLPTFDYSQIRPRGERLKTFGGISSGPQPLKELHEKIRSLLDRNVGRMIDSTMIVDIMNLIGKCVVAGNVRRSAEIALGSPTDQEFLHLKNYKRNKHREAYGWTSNNSIVVKPGYDYSNITDLIASNGEPGVFWLSNAQAYSRMNGLRDDKDIRVQGVNPCSEQSLESYEMCCLVETFLPRQEGLGDFLRTLKFAYLYAKTVTLGKTHWSETNRVMLRNRRIGCSVSGVTQFLAQRGVDELKHWLEKGYKEIQKLDEKYSEWMAIPRSIKTTSVKPSGTVSLLAGATPGVHFPHSRYYLRRLRIPKDTEFAQYLEKKGYTLEPAFGAEKTTVVVSVPVDVGESKTIQEVSMWEQLELAALLQQYWADNQVSCTVSFDAKQESNQIESALDYFQYRLKSISFLPRNNGETYRQMPYEEIDEKTYRKLKSGLEKIEKQRFKGQQGSPDTFCDSDVCEVKEEK